VLNYENNQQDALYRLIYYSKSSLHVSGDVFAHHQEHLTVFTVSGSVHPSCCRLVSRMGHQPAATWMNTTRRRSDHNQRHCYHHTPKVKPEAVTAVVELLMMGVRTPETCRAVNKCQDIKLEKLLPLVGDLLELKVLFFRCFRYHRGYDKD